ncbi:MauE/DoxX family redox-associated membrane protein [Derxia gummosa]|uniref:Methylamine utilization protein MauE n=1 Tax=Derxia gummosa DSM 723 TaxID=1121388 RepID=A0A8B6X8Q0_9BURK|nr:MauE/DoxX family redox-associated membrane protein [Derxia gummosa]
MNAAFTDLAALAGTVFLILLFTRAAWHKTVEFDRFTGYVADYRVLPAVLARPAAAAATGAEALTVGALVVPGTSAAGATGAAALLLLYGAAMAVNLKRGRRHINCGCGGARLPVSRGLVARNAALAGLALLLARATPGAFSTTEAALAIAGGLLCWLVYELAAYSLANWQKLAPPDGAADFPH